MAKAKVALVTGATRGIGRAIADQLATRHFVVGTATTAAGAEAIGSSRRGIVMNVADDGSVDAAFQALAELEELPLVLVNNAGVTRDNLLMRMKPEEWQTVIETNVGGLYRVVKAALRPMMKARWGRIVNLSSVVARLGNAGQTNYVASKAAIEGFTRALAQEIGSRGITVNAVAPGLIDTDMTAALDDEQKAAMLAGVPLGALGTPGDVAAAVDFLAGESAGYITGETLHVNGGLRMS